MARPLADVRISLRRRGRSTYRIELIRLPFTRRFRIRRAGTRSRRLPEATATEIADQIRRWLVGSLELTDYAGFNIESLQDQADEYDDE